MIVYSLIYYKGSPCTANAACNNTCSEQYQTCTSPFRTLCDVRDGCQHICNGYGGCVPSEICDVQTTRNNIVTDTKSSESGDNTVAIVVGVAVPLFFLIIAVIVIVFVILLRRKGKNNNNNNNDVALTQYPLRGVKQIDIFERLGSGQFGEVFRGLMDVRYKKKKFLLTNMI